MRIKIPANGKFKKMLLEYLEKNASDVLVDKINDGKKTFTGCWNFITAEAKKEATNKCACIPDYKVFGWATHYFEEDAIEETKNSPKAAVSTSGKADTDDEDEDQEAKEPAKEQMKNFIDLSDFL